MADPILNPTFDRTYYVIPTQRRVRIVAHPDGEGYVYTYTSEHPVPKQEGDEEVASEADYYSKVLASLGLHKNTVAWKAAEAVFKPISVIAGLFGRGDNLHERSRHRGNIHSDTLFRHDTPVRIREKFASKK